MAKSSVALVLCLALVLCHSAPAKASLLHQITWFPGVNLVAQLLGVVFHIGDSLEFLCTNASVLEVTAAAFAVCDVSNPVAKGVTLYHLTNPGTRYFIAGDRGQCLRGLKLKVGVL